ncbi:S6 family peptidase, partial [Aggregatibacter sp.]
KPKFIAAFVALNLSPLAFAGHVYSGVDYQYFRDFAENKGKFTPGAQNIAVVNKQGETIGTMMQNAPMMDFSVVSRNGVAALVGDQYIASVAHNVGYGSVDFGMEGRNPDQHRFSYNIVKRNNYKNDGTHPYMTDYHNPRLAKFVTEAAPIEMVSNMQGNTYGDLDKYPMRVRIGSGWQFLRDDNDNGNHIAMAYNYLTAGNTFMQGWANNGEVSLSGDVRHPNQYGPLPISGSSGDSGSPMFIYDKTAGKWLLNGVLRSGHPYQGKENTYQIARKSYLDEIIAGDLLTVFDPSVASYEWTTEGNGSGKLTKGGSVVETTPLADNSLASSGRDESFGYAGPNPYMPAQHHGKNIYFGNLENGTVTLKNNIDQGAGGLTFEGDFVVQPTTDETWKGAGVSVSEGSTVTWKIKNPAGDRLSKIGQGTLLVNGKGENLGDISVGDGLVVLNQQADEQNKKQAFNQLGIVSGRPTVKLESADQVNPNNIYFGFRGGRLDLNGNALTFNRIQNTDEGAQIVNHNKDKEANVTILGNAKIDNEKDINQSKATAFNGWFGETNAALHNGRLNLNYQPTHADSVFLLSGGTNLNGDITQESGTLVFSGRPTPHAYNHQNRPALIGRPQGEVVQDDDWLNRTFKADNFIINGGSAVVSRNVSEISGNWQLSKDAKATFGVTDKQANFICARSDWTGLTKCDNQTLSDKAFRSIERTKIKGSLSASDSATLLVQGLADVVGSVMLSGFSRYHLTHNATQTGMLHVNDRAVATVDNATLAGDVWLSDITTLNLVNTRFTHQIRGSKHTSVSLSDNAHWTLPESTRVGNLSLDNSQITLNPDFTTQKDNQTFNTLEVLGDLDGNGTINYRTYLQENKGDHVIVRGKAAGNFVLNVRNTGAEPQNLAQLSLLELNNPAQSDDVNVSLANGSVDAGAYRYELRNDDFDYRLYNPKKEKELADQERIAEEKRKADEAARLAEEKRKAEEAARLEEEKRKAEEAARLAEEKRKAEEAARLAEEKRKAEEAARLAEEKRKTEEAARLAEEKRKQEEAARLAEEKRKVEEAARLAEEKRKADEAARLVEEKRKADEAARLAEEKRKADEAARLAEEKRKADEAARLAEEKRKAEDAARLAEEERKAEEAARLAEEKRKADEAAHLAEEKRKVDEAARLAEEKRKADEAARLAEENRKADEAARLAEEKRKAEEAARLAEEKRKAEEAARLAEEKRKQEEAARLAEEKRKAEETARLAEEKRKAEEAARLAEEKRKQEEAARLAEEKRKADEAARLAEEKRKAEEAARLAEEKRKQEEAARLAEENRKAEEAARLAEEKRKADEAARLAEEKRKAEEAARLAEEKRKAEEAARAVKQKDMISRYSNSALSELSATANNVLFILDELNKQLVSNDTASVWVNTANRSRRYGSDDFRSYKQETHLTQLGAQHIDDNYRLGLLFSHARANNTFDDNIGSKNRLTMLSAFGKYDFANGLNVFADMSYGSSAGEIRGELQDADIQRHIVALGAGVGYQLKLGKLAFKPNASVHRYHISSEDYQYDQSRIHTPSANFNVYQAGVTVDYTFGPWAGVMLRPSVSVNYVDASDSKLAVQVNQIPLMQRFDRYWQQEIGLSAGFGGWQVGGYAAQSRGKQLDKQHQFGLKVGYRW